MEGLKRAVATTPPTVSPALAAALEAQRENCNALFAQARRDAPQLDGAEFLASLARLDPLVVAIEASPAAQTEKAVAVLYRVLLEMHRKGLAGPHERQPGFESRWLKLTLRLASFLATAPSEIVGPMTNALFHLVTTPLCRPDDWIDRVGALAAAVEDPAQLKQAGIVAAWLSGMADYRQQALAISRKLPLQVAGLLLGSANLSERARNALLDRLEANPWFLPEPGGRQLGVQLVAEAGGFRGLGGPFRRPPRVLSSREGLLATDGVDWWLLSADAFGAVFRRVHSDGEVASESGRHRISKAGVVGGPRWKGGFPLLAGASSFASTETTLAVTLPHSHRVFLVGEVES